MTEEHPDQLKFYYQLLGTLNKIKPDQSNEDIANNMIRFLPGVGLLGHVSILELDGQYNGHPYAELARKGFEISKRAKDINDIVENSKFYKIIEAHPGKANLFDPVVIEIGDVHSENGSAYKSKLVALCRDIAVNISPDVFVPEAYLGTAAREDGDFVFFSKGRSYMPAGEDVRFVLEAFNHGTKIVGYDNPDALKEQQELFEEFVLSSATMSLNRLVGEKGVNPIVGISQFVGLQRTNMCILQRDHDIETGVISEVKDNNIVVLYRGLSHSLKHNTELKYVPNRYIISLLQFAEIPHVIIGPENIYETDSGVEPNILRI